MFRRSLFSIIRLLPIGRVPLSLALLKLGIYPRTPVRFRHKDGFLMLLDLSDWVQLVIYLFGDYKYEASEVRLWEKLARQSDQVIDIGAHVGYYSLLAKAADPDLQIEVFEPSKTTFKNLSRNVQLNNWDITINHLALGNKEGVITMNQPDTHNSGMNFMSDAEGMEADVVPLSTWDIHFAGLMSSGKRVLVKIDAEGAEYQILEGGIKYISEVKPVIFIELLNSTLSRFGSDTSKVYDLVVPMGYAFYRLDENEQLQKCAYGEEGEVLILVHKDDIGLFWEITE